MEILDKLSDKIIDNSDVALVYAIDKRGRTYAQIKGTVPHLLLLIADGIVSIHRESGIEFKDIGILLNSAVETVMEEAEIEEVFK